MGGAGWNGGQRQDDAAPLCPLGQREAASAGGGVYHGDLWDLTNGAYLMAWTAGAQREEGACVQIGGRWATTGTPLASPPGALPDQG